MGPRFDRWGQSFVTDGAGGEGINYVFPGATILRGQPGAANSATASTPAARSTAALEIISGRHLPDDWQGNMITNDFRGHRVCRFVVSEDGAGYAAQREAAN